MKLYDYRSWVQTILQYALIPVIAIGIFLLHAPLYWYFAALVVSLIFTLYGFNIACHHTFAHRLFKFPRLIEVGLMYFGTLSAIASPLAWALAHDAHHRYVDTEDDPNSPYYKGWKILFFINHKPKKVVYRSMRHLFEDPAQVWFDSNRGFWITMFSWPILMFILFGFYGLIFLWAIPTFYSLTAALIFTLAHWGSPIEKGGHTATKSIWLHIISFGDGDHQRHHDNWKDCGNTVKLFSKAIGGKYIK